MAVYGIGRICEKNSQEGFKNCTPIIIKLRVEYDVTGLIVFDGLKPGTEYLYQVGYRREMVPIKEENIT